MRIRYLLIAFVIVCALSQTVYADNSTPSTSITKEIKNTHASKALIKDILLFLNTKEIQTQKLASIESSFSISDFPKEFWGIGISVYTTKGEKFSTVKAKTPIVTNALTGLHRQIHRKRNKRIIERIRLDFIDRIPWDIRHISFHQDDTCIKKFYFGYDGVKVVGKNKKNFFFFPEDAFDENIHTASALEEKIKKHFNTENLENLAYFKFRTQSFLSFDSMWFKIHKGNITLSDINPALIQKVVHRIAAQEFIALKSKVLSSNDNAIDYSSHGEHILPLLLYSSIFNNKNIEKYLDHGIKILDKNFYKNILTKNDLYEVLLKDESLLSSLLIAHSFLTQYKKILNKNTFEIRRQYIKKILLKYFKLTLAQKENIHAVSLITIARKLEFLTSICNNKSPSTFCRKSLQHTTSLLRNKRESLVGKIEYQMIPENLIMQSLTQNKYAWSTSDKKLSTQAKSLLKINNETLVKLIDTSSALALPIDYLYIRNLLRALKNSKNIPKKNINKTLNVVSRKGIETYLSSYYGRPDRRLPAHNLLLLSSLLDSYYIQ